MDLGPLEQDFAALDDDLVRIAAMPVTLGSAGTKAFDEMMRATGAASGDAPFGDSFLLAIQGMLRDSTATDLHGNTTVNIDQRALLTHGAPVMRDVVTALETRVQDALGDLGVVVDLPGDSGGKKKVKLKVDLMSVFSNLIEQIAEKGKPKR
jgi:hypothetical protein